VLGLIEQIEQPACVRPRKGYEVNGMRNLLNRFSHRVLLSVAVALIVLIFWLQRLQSRSVRAELIRLQQESGFTFAWIGLEVSPDKRVQAVSFDTHTVVRLKDSLQVFRPDRFSIGEYPEVTEIDECWSHDQTRLASTMIDRSTHVVKLGFLDLNSKQIRAITINVEQSPHVTSQCWSQDDQRLVYETDDGSVRLYEVENNDSTAIAKGTDPTWSPEGKWIAFRDGDTYHAIHPDGTEEKELFRNHWGKAISALYWSPDSRIVAYVRELGFLQGGALDAEFNRRRRACPPL